MAYFFFPRIVKNSKVIGELFFCKNLFASFRKRSNFDCDFSFGLSFIKHVFGLYGYVLCGTSTKRQIHWELMSTNALFWRLAIRLRRYGRSCSLLKVLRVVLGLPQLYVIRVYFNGRNDLLVNGIHLGQWAQPYSLASAQNLSIAGKNLPIISEIPKSLSTSKHRSLHVLTILVLAVFFGKSSGPPKKANGKKLRQNRIDLNRPL